MFLRPRLISSVIAVLFLVTFAANAQCKLHVKKQCLPALAPFSQSGQMSSARFAPGENAELQVTFNSGIDYRLMVCSEGVLGDVNFKVYDNDKQEVYNSKKDENAKNNSSSKVWDFNVANTQQLNIVLDIPPSDSPNKIIPEGCISIIVGFKKQ